MAIGARRELDVAETLRLGRERRGLEIADAYQTTRILPVYLRALEEDAPIEDFPAPVYAVSFLREYARYLGLDEEPLVEAFKARRRLEEEPMLLEAPQPIERRPSRRAARALVAISVLALVVVAIDALSSSPATREPTEPRPSASGATPPTASAPPIGSIRGPSGGETAVRGIHAVLRVREPCWVSAIGDDTILVQRTVDPPRTIDLEAKHVLTLVLGNAGGVRLEVNGKRIPLETEGAVAHLSFEWRRGRVVTR